MDKFRNKAGFMNATGMYILLILMLWLPISTVIAQENAGKKAECPQPKGDITPPCYPGGQEACMQYIAKNLTYPQEAQENGVSGRVFVEFTVKEDGGIENILIHKSKLTCPNHEKQKTDATSGASMQKTSQNSPREEDSFERCRKLLEAEALRVIHIMPKWQPAMRDGKPVKLKCFIPVNFKLQ